VSTATAPDTLHDALRLAEEVAWSVLPLHWPASGGCSCKEGEDCKSAGKHPRNAHGSGEATTDAAIIRGWWAKWPRANLAIATGDEHGIFMVGPDGSAGLAALAELERQHGALPMTPCARSGSADPGRHYYFSYPAGAVIMNARNHRGLPIDVRGNGGLAVAPPSLHKSTRRYEWEIPPGRLRSPSRRPGWWSGARRNTLVPRPTPVPTAATVRVTVLPARR
jgi:putative DNA primase/helicase